jgi:hypothetical protein
VLSYTEPCKQSQRLKRDPFGGFESEKAQEEKHFQRTRIKAEVTGFVVGIKG